MIESGPAHSTLRAAHAVDLPRLTTVRLTVRIPIDLQRSAAADCCR